MTRLTLPRLRAMANALNAILAGEMDGLGDEGDIPAKDYDAASDWVAEQIVKREARRA